MATKTIELRKDIVKLLKTTNNNIYCRRADTKAMYPHVVYTIEDIYEAKVLNIDIWDKADSTTRIEELADNIENLKDEMVNNENHSFIIYYNEDRKWVDDDDKDIQRINMSFEIRYYGKER